MAINENVYIDINKFTDQLPMVGNWEMDIIVVFFVFAYIGFFIPQSFMATIIILMIGIGITTLINRLKKGKVKGFFFHILYMMGIKKTKTFPPSYMRYFLGE